MPPLVPSLNYKVFICFGLCKFFLDKTLKISFRKKLDLGYLCTEKALAGPGIKPIYEFLSETVHKDMEFDGNLSTEEIVEKGVKNQDALCRKVVDFFLDMYATEVGNMVCREKPLSGIYLVGN